MGRILVVEDEEILAENLKTFLGRRSHDVRIAQDGKQAIEMLESFAPDAVVLDYGLAPMNGLQTYTEILRRHARNIGCVVITGYPLEMISCHANEQGIRHLLGKPFGLGELEHLLERSAEDASR
ncbi:MAG: response regulator [Betaproteobacteria bacterium]|nr:response regulator [Betaproteobacteria bacterium]